MLIENWFKPFSTPGNIRGLTLLFEFPNMMLSEVNYSEFFAVSRN